MPTSEEWDAACSKIFGSSEPDLKPLADLIACATHIPAGIRDMLASMIDPEGPGYLRFKLRLINLDNDRNSIQKEAETILPVVIAYRKLRSAGLSAEKAAATASEEFNVSEKTVFNYVKTWDERVNWLKGGQSA